MNGRALLLVFSIFAFIAPIFSAHACSCAEPPSPAEAFQKTEAVLLGKVIDIQEGPGPRHITAKIRVVKIWKGGRGFTAEVLTTSDRGAMCGFNFQDGKTYLIYAYKNQDERLETNNCTRSAPQEGAREDFAFLMSQPGIARGSSGCGSKNILAGDIYLFVGAFVYLLRRKASRRSSCCKHTVKHNHDAKH